MGRSQVLRNQRLGGRSGRGRTNSSTNTNKTNRAHPSQPRNTSSSQQWRQFPINDVDPDTGREDDTKFKSTASSSSSGQQDLDEQFLALEAHGNYANYQVSSEEDKYMYVTIAPTGATGLLDIQKINRGLSALTLHELLRLPPHLTESLENATASAAARRHTAAASTDNDIVGIESTSSLEDRKIDDIGSPPRNLTQAGVSSVITEVRTPVANTISKTSDANENMDDDDMESWLDSVIS